MSVVVWSVPDKTGEVHDDQKDDDVQNDAREADMVISHDHLNLNHFRFNSEILTSEKQELESTLTNIPVLTLRWPRGGGGACKIFSCSLIIGTSFHQKTFQNGPTVWALKLDKGCWGGRVWHPPPPHGLSLAIFLTMKMTLNLDKFWYGVR